MFYLLRLLFQIVHQGHILCSTLCANTELHKFSVETQTFMLRKWANKKTSQFTEARLRDDWRIFNTFPFMQNKICFTSKAKRSPPYQGGMDFNTADIFSWWVMALSRGCTVPDSTFQLSIIWLSNRRLTPLVTRYLSTAVPSWSMASSNSSNQNHQCSRVSEIVGSAVGRNCEDCVEITRARGREREKEISPFYSSYSSFLVLVPFTF